MNHWTAVSFGAICMVLCWLSCAAGAEPQLDVLGHIGGENCRAVAVHDGKAYVNEGEGLSVVDVSDPAAVRRTGTLYLPPVTDDHAITINEIAVSATRAYVACEHPGLYVVDVASATVPEMLLSYDAYPDVNALAVQGTLVYLAQGIGGSLIVLDLADPQQPLVVGTTPLPADASSRDLVVAGTRAYLSYDHTNDSTDAVAIYDIGGATPTEIGRYPFSGEVHGVAVDSERLYVAVDRQGVHVVSLADEAHPQLLTVFGRGLKKTESVEVNGDYLYVGGSNGRPDVVDLSTPETPVRVAELAAVDESPEIIIDGTLALVAAEELGLVLVDISTPAVPQQQGALEMLYNFHYVQSVGSLVYASVGTSLRILDASLPSSPVLVGTYETPGTSISFAVDGGYAYLAAKNNGLQIVDVSDPAQPALVTTFNPAGFVSDVVVRDDVAYITTFVTGLMAIDVSDPAQPQELGSVDLDGFAMAVSVADGLAYVTTTTPNGIQLVDVSNPALPQALGSNRTTAAVNGIDVDAPYVYATDNDGNVRVIDASDVNNPLLVGILRDLAETNQVQAYGTQLFVAAGHDGVRLVNVSNPEGPVLQSATAEFRGEAVSLCKHDDLLFAGTLGFGLYTVQFSVDCPTTQLRYGDVNDDGETNNLDALYIQTLFLQLMDCFPRDTDCDGWGPEPYSAFCPGKLYGDVDDNGEVNNLDALMVQAFFIGTLPCFLPDTDCDGLWPDVVE